MYVKVKNGVIEKYPYTYNELKIDNPNVSIPIELIENYGVYKVIETEAPETDSISYAVKRNLPEFIDGKYTIVWDVIQKTQEQLDDDLRMLAASARNARNDLLAASDWTQGKDIPDAISNPWAAYRQLLRDLPNQEGFPTNIEWPVLPT